ncbi:hypothetical protein EJ05DRAFT_535466 [Pseudovirgaria hyperparasitica]|uniref:Neutral protease 2 n=1 Tax=Pseudovirgaria hyperparasitica TaxID=470096 RepID=A0A6A6WK33_9PEZI|nr:uncharacterized protein EJ05DRAFT_535466 [Pseudovirgaria hyperparasitica]KAF2762211.1 hypothetical protein EJ05DRAFT_535466 [Pseudovirgaria hyperparasitica]
MTISTISSIYQPVDVSLSQDAASGIKATIANNGAETLSLLGFDNLLDDDGYVEKLMVFSGDVKVDFNGYHLYPAIDRLRMSDFTSLYPGETIEITIDPAEVHDLSIGGNYTVFTKGLFLLGTPDSTSLSGASVPYSSNKLAIEINGTRAAQSFRDFASQSSERASMIDCSDPEQSAKFTNITIKEASLLASHAASAARSGPADQFEFFFKTTNTTAREHVAARFDAMASAVLTIGTTPYLHCVEPYGMNYCTNRSSIAAYATNPGGNLFFCPVFYDYPVMPDTCRGYDSRAGILLHEMSHNEEIYKPATGDYAYGPNGSLALPSDQALLNADSFLAYAFGVKYGCYLD